MNVAWFILCYYLVIDSFLRWIFYEENFERFSDLIIPGLVFIQPASGCNQPAQELHTTERLYYRLENK